MVVASARVAAQAGTDSLDDAVGRNGRNGDKAPILDLDETLIRVVDQLRSYLTRASLSTASPGVRSDTAKSALASGLAFGNDAQLRTSYLHYARANGSSFFETNVQPFVQYGNRNGWHNRNGNGRH